MLEIRTTFDNTGQGLTSTPGTDFFKDPSKPAAAQGKSSERTRCHLCDMERIFTCVIRGTNFRQFN
jgi:hypothetical protein